MIEFVRMLTSTALGLVMVGGLLTFIYRRHAESWQRFQPSYGQDWKNPVAKRRMQNLLIYSEGDFARHYPGLVTLGVFPNGLGIRFLPIVDIFHHPIFVPYEDISGWQQKWYINAKSVELSFAKIPELRIIMPASQVAWIAEQGYGNIHISPDKPPTNNWPYATYFSALLLFALALALCVGLYIKADGDWGEMWTLLGPGHRGSEL